MANDVTSDKIEAVLNEMLPTLEDYEEGDILIEWAVICYVSNPDSEKQSGYPMLFSNNDIPSHHARGLYRTALRYLDKIQ